MIDYLFLFLFFAGLIGIIVSGEMDFEGCFAKGLGVVSLIMLTAALLMVCLSVSTPDLYIVQENKTIKGKYFSAKKYKLNDWTLIEMSRDSSYIINQSHIPIVQESVTFCEDFSRVGTPVPDYSLDTLTSAVLRYRKDQVRVFVKPASRASYKDYMETADTRKVKEVRIFYIGVAGEYSPAGNAYRRLMESVPEFNYGNL